MNDSASITLLAYCRPGFESECAQELAAHDAALGGGGHARTERASGYVQFTTGADAARAIAAAGVRASIFARQVLRVLGRATAMPKTDRLAALLPLIEGDAGAPPRWCDAWVEAPDSDEARALAPLCRGLNAALIAVLKQRKWIDRASRERLHVCLTAGDAAIVAVADVDAAAPWPGGIVRLKFPPAAPSRSTLKLEEALLVLLGEDERARWLEAGMRAVDLGASPGGWTWQLVRRGLHVTAVDNGPMDAQLVASGLVDHLRVDGFRYRPRQPVDWLVCDMVEQPRRIAELMAAWLADGDCRRAIFNLKLPMKKRYAEVQLAFALLEGTARANGRKLELRAKQLYHDREEITVFARLV